MKHQLDKLARTLINSGLASTPADAMKKAKDILKVDDTEPVDKAKLPKIEDIEPVPPSSRTKLDHTHKEVVDEDAEKIYNKHRPSEKQHS